MSKPPENPAESSSEYQKFREFAKKLVAVPKQEVDTEKVKREQAEETKKKG